LFETSTIYGGLPVLKCKSTKKFGKERNIKGKNDFSLKKLGGGTRLGA